MVDRYIEVRAQIPERLLARYYERVADLLREQPRSDTSSEIAPRGLTGAPHSWTEPEVERNTVVYPSQGDGGDVVVTTPSLELVPSASIDALNLYLQLSPRALEPLQYLVDRPGQRVSGEELAQDIDVLPAELTGSLSSIRKRCDALNRPMPLRYRSGPNGGTYWMENRVAEVFRKAYEDLKWGGPDEEGAEVFSELIDNTWRLLQLIAGRQSGRSLLLNPSQYLSSKEEFQQGVQRQLDELEEEFGQLAKRRAALLRKYDPQSIEDLGLWEKPSTQQTRFDTQQEVFPTKAE